MCTGGVGWDKAKSRTHLARVSGSGVSDWGEGFSGDPGLHGVSNDGVHAVPCRAS